MKKSIQCICRVMPKLFLIGLFLAITGCITTTGHRVEAFKRSHNSFVGKTISVFEKAAKNEIKNQIYIGIKSLPNGNMEKEYANFWARSYAPGTKTVVYDCHYFYEYELESQLIVKFRIEEKRKDACQIPGV